MENWAGQNDKQISALTSLLKSAANLMVFQKYFDQWDSQINFWGSVCLQWCSIIGVRKKSNSISVRNPLLTSIAAYSLSIKYRWKKAI